MSDPASNSRQLYLLSFLTGGALMGVEVMGGKMIAPYFGTSIYVWSAVIGFTMGGLAVGYFLGGYLSERYSEARYLLSVVSLTAILVALMPFTSKWIMTAASDMGTRTGIVISCAIFLFPAFIGFGTVSPWIIKLVNSSPHTTGRSAGSIFAVSTVGGIVVTFWFAFHVLPFWGYYWAAYIATVLLLVVPALRFLDKR